MRKRGGIPAMRSPVSRVFNPCLRCGGKKNVSTRLLKAQRRRHGLKTRDTGGPARRSPDSLTLFSVSPLL